MNPQQLHRSVIWISLILLVAGVLCFNHILELRAEEGRRAIVSIEMIHTDDYIVPHLQGLPYYNKPPLYNWILAATFQVFGSYSEVAVRLPGVLSFLATALVFFLFARSYTGRDTALLMAGAYLTVADLLFYGSINAGEIDLFYSLVVVLQALLIFHFHEKQQYLWLYLCSYLLTAVGVLTKGLPSVAFQGLTLVVWFLWTKSFRKLFTWHHVLGMLLFLLLTGSYFYVYAAHNEVTGYLVNLFKQASQRTANEYDYKDIISTILFFPVYLWRYLLPWSLLVVFIFLKPVRQSLAANKFIVFCLVFILANIPLYWTAPELRIRYIYMFFPFLVAVLVYAGCEAYKQTRSLNTIGNRVLQVLIGLAGVGCFALVFLPFEKDIFSIGVLITTGVLLIGFVYLYRNASGHVFWLLVLALAIGRMAYNLVGLPYTQTQMKFRNITDDMLNQCSGCEVHLTGELMPLVPDITFRGDTLYRDTLYVPVEFPYQIPYYLALKTGNILTFRDEAETGSYYIVYEGEQKPPGHVLGRYPRVFGEGTLLFFQAEE